jgi:3-methyl-2-oxobutanoate hydroxymethyltransferase
MRARGERIVMVTTYDAPSARLADAAGIDVLLVGDSAGTTVLGGTTTVPVTMTEMLTFTRAASRGVSRALLVADMPFGSYQISDQAAVRNAIRFAQAGAHAVKVEGAGHTLPRVEAIVGAGIAVMGHIGLTPQSATLLGGYRAQGRTAAAARRLFIDARALEAAGCFALVLEAIPAIVAEGITAALGIPTIGIGAGAGCTGQVLVWHDLLGLTPPPLPRFVKPYANLTETIQQALAAYAEDVRSGRFPGAEHTYAMPAEERAALEAEPPKTWRSRSTPG